MVQKYEFRNQESTKKFKNLKSAPEVHQNAMLKFGSKRRQKMEFKKKGKGKGNEKPLSIEEARSVLNIETPIKNFFNHENTVKTIQIHRHT